MTHEIIFYRAPDGDQRIEVLFRDESFWMPQRALAGLFDVQVPVISKHLKNIFESDELVPDSVVSIMERTAEAEYDDFRPRQDRDYISDAIGLSREATLSILETVHQEGSRQVRRNPKLFDRGVESAWGDCTQLPVSTDFSLFDGHLMGAAPKTVTSDEFWRQT